MSEFRIDQIKNQDATGGPNVAGITTFTGTSGIVMPSGTTVDRASQGILGGVSKQNLFLYHDPGLSLSSGLLTDLSGNDFHMQVVGPTLTIAGTDNRTSYLTFDGSNDYARLTTDQNPQALSSFPRSGSMTLGMTLKINTFTHVRPFMNRWNGVSQFRFFMFNSSTGEPGGNFIQYCGMAIYDAEGKSKTSVYNDNFTNVSTTPDYHFTFTLNAETGEFLAYRDGKENTLFTNDDTGGQQLIGLRRTTDCDLDIGINQAYNPDRFGAFRFYNLYMYDRVLSGSEIKTIHNSFVDRGYNFE
jgi:hypothetical protein